MPETDILILGGRETQALLAGRERDIIEAVRDAYVTHGRGESSLPHSTFLRFPDNPDNRIIALPAYLGGDFGVAGLKWIASFPGNLERGMERASAVLVLNSTETGRPEAILEASLISAKRTAASAALAAQTLHSGPVERAALVGCGLINFEIARFLRTAFPSLKGFVIYDIKEARASEFAARCAREFGPVEVETVADAGRALASAGLISLATTALSPNIRDLSACPAGATILHVSLRDLTPETILSSDNVVDDVDHVCRAQTSVHLAEQLTGARGFIRCTLADILDGRAAARGGDGRAVVFSPFGLGVLDLAVGKLVYEEGRRGGVGTTLGAFLPGG
ncbi:MAG TPA: 2,3-diaminopropionate biosynthesis protein SbnB [Pyrinomonadaceae bacterium]|nr:2,3-diaminopropionate biosynthesis protein SbnB [Pyrinomonadaceae bacterium]